MNHTQKWPGQTAVKGISFQTEFMFSLSTRLRLADGHLIRDAVSNKYDCLWCTAHVHQLNDERKRR